MKKKQFYIDEPSSLHFNDLCDLFFTCHFLKLEQECNWTHFAAARPTSPITMTTAMGSIFSIFLYEISLLLSIPTNPIFFTVSGITYVRSLDFSKGYEISFFGGNFIQYSSSFLKK